MLVTKDDVKGCRMLLLPSYHIAFIPVIQYFFIYRSYVIFMYSNEITGGYGMLKRQRFMLDVGMSELSFFVLFFVSQL